MEILTEEEEEKGQELTFENSYQKELQNETRTFTLVM